MADNQVPIYSYLALKSIPKTRKCVPEQQETTRQEDILRCSILQEYWTWIQDTQISNRI